MAPGDYTLATIATMRWMSLSGSPTDTGIAISASLAREPKTHSYIRGDKVEDQDEMKSSSRFLPDQGKMKSVWRSALSHMSNTHYSEIEIHLYTSRLLIRLDDTGLNHCLKSRL